MVDPTTNHKRKPDRAVFITPFAIDRHVLESNLCQLQEIEQRDLTVIDGPLLADLIKEHTPDSLQDLSLELHYRAHVATYVNEVAESAAFQLRTPILLDEVYIDLAIASEGPQIRNNRQQNSGRA